MFATALDLAHVNISVALRAEMKKRDRDSELKPGMIWYRRDTLAYWAHDRSRRLGSFTPLVANSWDDFTPAQPGITHGTILHQHNLDVL